MKTFCFESTFLKKRNIQIVENEVSLGMSKYPLYIMKIILKMFNCVIVSEKQKPYILAIFKMPQKMPILKKDIHFDRIEMFKQI